MSMSMLKRIEAMRDGLRACRDLSHILKALDSSGIEVPEMLRGSLESAIEDAQAGLNAYNGEE
jgi:hypothetical protein